MSSSLLMHQGLRQAQTQVQVIAPQMRRSLEILQAPMLELRDMVLEELQTNPTLEEDFSGPNLSLDSPTAVASGDIAAGEKEEGDVLGMREDLNFEQGLSILKKMDEDWREDFRQDAHTNYSAEQAERRQHFFDSFVSETSLQEYIMEQIKLADCSLAERQILPYIIGCLDDRGFLTLEPMAIAELVGQPLSIVESALELLRGLDPIGLGTANLKECLLYQLRYKGLEETLAYTILKEHFDLLLRRRIQDLAKKLQASLQDVQKALAIIASLDPAPGRRFSEDTNRAVLADVLVEKDAAGQWNVSLNRDYIPSLRLNPIYQNLLSQAVLPSSDQEYLKSKLQSGKFLMQAIEQRQSTLARIAKQLLIFQKDFFEHGIKKLHPLTMHTVAEALKVHETTVSRAIANKYMQGPFGLVELKFFFTSGYALESGEAIANTSIKDKIAQLIALEDPRKPYSDQALVELLKEDNIPIARRTVAKYREELKILPTHLRRVYG